MDNNNNNNNNNNNYISPGSGFFASFGSSSYSGTTTANTLDTLSFESNENKQYTPLELIFQYLNEKGYQRALQTLQEESGELFSAEAIPMGAKLLSILDEYQDLKNALSSTDLKADDSDEELESLGTGNYPSDLVEVLNNTHSQNILTIRFLPSSKQILSGSSDKTIKLTNFETGEVSAIFSGWKAPVICMDVHPVYENLILGGSMDFSHFIMDVTKDDSEAVIQTFTTHQKYVVRTKWSPDGKKFATASYDKSISIFSRDESTQKYEMVHTSSFKGAVESLVFAHDGETLIVSVRDDNCLHYIDTQTFKKEKVNMNQNGDSHVSFTSMDLAIFPNGKYLLICTDKDKLIMQKVGGKVSDGETTRETIGADHVRTFYGSSNDSFAQPRCLVHPNGKYVFATSQDHSVYIWEVSSQKIVSKLSGHAGVVRDIHFNEQLQLLASCSFDKKINVYGNK